MNAQLAASESGLHFDYPAEQYHVRQLGQVSNSAIKRALRSAAHYHAWATEAAQDKDTPALAFGRAFHAALLEPERFAQDWAVAPDFGDLRTKVAKEARDAWRAKYPHAVLLPQEDADRINGMLESVRAHPWARRAIRDGAAEVTCLWTDQESGLPCKARADYFVDGNAPFVLDVKTCEDASPEAFARSIATYGYHTQHAHYCDGWRVAYKPLANYLLLAVEHQPPYAVALYHLDTASEQRGYDLRAEGIARIARGMKTGLWPAYSNDIRPISLPRWALTD